MNSHIKTIEDGTIWTVDDAETDATVRREDVDIEIYEQWVKISGPTPIWVPREGVEQIHEF